MRRLAWLRSHAWPASPLHNGVTTKTPSPTCTPCVTLHCHVPCLGLHLLDVGRGLLLLHPPPPAASFFFLFSSFLFSVLLLFLSCSDESDDSLLEELSSGGEAG